MAHGVKRRRNGFLEPRNYRYAIFSEGTVTEPAYFTGMKIAIEKNAAYRNMIYVKGTGRETQRVLEAARQWVSISHPRHCQVWCLYDKDEFPRDHFNNVLQSLDALNKGHTGIEYYAGWSNECFEYWLVLHFILYRSNNGREAYTEILNEQFQKLLHKKYSKEKSACLSLSENGYPLLYEDILKSGSPKNAIRNAEKQLDYLEKQYGKELLLHKPSEAVPATTVYKLVRELAGYLGKDEKKYFL